MLSVHVCELDKKVALAGQLVWIFFLIVLSSRMTVASVQNEAISLAVGKNVLLLREEEKMLKSW